MSANGAAPSAVCSTRRMSDTNLELASRKLQSAISSVNDSISSNKRPSQVSGLEQAAAALVAIEKKNGPLRSGHSPDRADATEPELESSPGSGTSPDHAQSQSGSQSGAGARPRLTQLSGPAWLSCDRCAGGAGSENIAAPVARPPRHRRLTPAYASLRGMLRRRAVAPDDARVRPNSGPTRSSNWVDATEEETRTGKMNRPPRRPSLDSSKSDSSFVVDSPGTDEPTDPDNLRLQKTGHWYVLHPMTRYRAAWDYLLVALVLSSTLAVPLQLAFCDTASAALATPGTSLHQAPPLPSPRLVSHYNPHTSSCHLPAVAIVDVLFVVDLCSNFLFGYVVFNRATATVEIICRPDLIAKRYLRNWFALELLSLGPIATYSHSNPIWVHWLELLKILRLQRLLRVQARERQRANHSNSAPRRSMVAEKIAGIVKLLALFLVYSHICGCVYWFIGRIQEASI